MEEAAEEVEVEGPWFRSARIYSSPTDPGPGSSALNPQCRQLLRQCHTIRRKERAIQSFTAMTA